MFILLYVEDKAKPGNQELYQKLIDPPKMIKAFTIRSQFHFPKHPKSKSTNIPSKSVRLTPNSPPSLPSFPPENPPQILKTQNFKNPSLPESDFFKAPPNSEPINQNGRFNSKVLITGAVSVGVVLLVLGLDGDGHGGRALALGPEGPIMEEFWENVRRYALYALTVSTGVIYTIFQPIWVLLKNPISAVLVIAIVVGSVYIMSQVLSAMVGVSDFSYQYYY